MFVKPMFFPLFSVMFLISGYIILGKNYIKYYADFKNKSFGHTGVFQDLKLRFTCPAGFSKLFLVFPITYLHIYQLLLVMFCGYSLFLSCLIYLCLNFI